MRERLRLSVRGAVQGVGFRPFVYRLARSLELSGWVQNAPDGVVIEVEGLRDQIIERAIGILRHQHFPVKCRKQWKAERRRPRQIDNLERSLVDPRRLR